MKKPSLRSGQSIFASKQKFQRVSVAQGTWFWMNHVAPHLDTCAHDHAYLELAFILSGQAQHLTVHGATTCRAGDIFIIPPGAWHGYAQCRRMEVYNCLLSPQLLQNELGWTAHDPEMHDLLPAVPLYGTEIAELHMPERELPALREALNSLLHAFQEKHFSKAHIVGRLLLLLRMLTAAKSKAARTGTKSWDIHPSVRRGLQLMNQEVARAWTLGSLASELHINPSYLVRLFHRQTGMAPMKYLSNRRAELAATLLLAERIPIGEVGQRVGWPEPKQFARSFKQVYGVNARDYRQKMASRLGQKIRKDRAGRFYSETIPVDGPWAIVGQVVA